mgnify:CR=1 FL=1
MAMFGGGRFSKAVARRAGAGIEMNSSSDDGDGDDGDDADDGCDDDAGYVDDCCDDDDGDMMITRRRAR